MSSRIVPLGTGKCSDFGGPDDQGVGPLEGLALVSLQDLTGVPASVIRRALFVIDLSPGALAALGCETDDLVTVEAILPGGLS